MDLHPIFVHFPIGLLTIYSLLELVRHKIIIDKFNLFFTKAFLVIVGTISGYFTLQTGDMAADLLKKRSSIVHFHEMFAQMSIFIFSILSLGYFLKIIEPILIKRNFKFLKHAQILSQIILSPIVSISLSILGFILLSITGGLGGILVYGPESDIATKILYSIFNVQ